ncbi:hypothetical protein ACEPAF_9146 [Sanghuangporus sanghuang]
MPGITQQSRRSIQPDGQISPKSLMRGVDHGTDSLLGYAQRQDWRHHVWRKADLNHYKWNASGDQPPFRVDKHIELIAELLPKLENLWLKHYKGGIEIETVINQAYKCDLVRKDS